MARTALPAAEQNQIGVAWRRASHKMQRGQRQREVERGPGPALPLNAFVHSLYRQIGSEFIPDALASVVAAGLKTRHCNGGHSLPAAGTACGATTRWWLNDAGAEPASESGRYNGAITGSTAGGRYNGRRRRASQPFFAGRLSRERVPPWASAIWRLRARPMPVPPGLVVKKGTKTLAVF